MVVEYLKIFWAKIRTKRGHALLKILIEWFGVNGILKQVV